MEDLAVGKANDGIAQFVEVSRAGLIVFDLLGMGIAIDLDTEFGFVAIEVDDEAAARPVVSGVYGMLPAKLEAIELAIAEARPEFLLGGSLRVAQFTSVLEQNRRCAWMGIVVFFHGRGVLIIALIPTLLPMGEGCAFPLPKGEG